MNRTTLMTLIGISLAATALAADTQRTVEHRLSVREVMVSIVTPATNTLWGVEDPQTDDDWRPFEEAAAAVIAAGTLVAAGGAGPNDNAWAADPEWQAYVATMLAAGEDALAAVRARDLDALFTATEVIYPPCEECHLAFHPEMQQ